MKVGKYPSTCDALGMNPLRPVERTRPVQLDRLPESDERDRRGINLMDLWHIWPSIRRPQVRREAV